MTVDVSQWPQNSSLWSQSNSFLSDYAGNGVHGWTVLYAPASTLSGDYRTYPCESPRLASTADGDGRSVRAGQTITYPSSGLFPDIHFGYDLSSVRIRQAGSLSAGAVRLRTMWRFTKWTSAPSSAVNGNGAQPDIEFQVFDPTQGSGVYGDLMAYVNEVISTTGLSTLWGSSVSTNVMTRGGVGTAFRWEQTTLFHNWSESEVIEVGSIDWASVDGPLVFAYRFHDAVAPYTLDYEPSGFVGAGIYAPVTASYSASATDTLTFDESLADSASSQYSVTSGTALAFTEYHLVDVSDQFVVSAEDDLELIASVAVSTGILQGVEVADSLRYLASLVIVQGESDSVEDSLVMTSSWEVVSTVAPDDVGSGGFIPVM